MDNPINNLLQFLKDQNITHDDYTHTEKYIKLNDDYNSNEQIFKDIIININHLLISKYGKEVGSQYADRIIYNILDWLADQSNNNPLIYVSHGSNHSLKVAKYIQMIYENIQALQISIYNIYKLKYTKTHNYTQEEIFHTDLVLQLLGLLHDVGYPDVEKNTGTQPDKVIDKFVHSTSSKLLIKDEINWFFKLLRDHDDEKLINDFLEAIGQHNYDSIKCNVAGIPKCSFTPRDEIRTKLLIPELGEIYRTYTEGLINKNPFLFLIRLADNLDFSRSRMLDIQKTPEIIQLLKDTYNAPNRDELIDKFIEGCKHTNAVYRKDFRLSDDEIRMYNYFKINPQFLHWYSNWIVKSSYLVQNPGKLDIPSFTLTVTFYENDPEYPKLNYQDNQYASVFQIIRLKESLESLKLNRSISEETVNFANRIQVILKEGDTDIITFNLSDVETLYNPI